MSEVHVEAHSSPIKTPKQLIIVILASLLVPITIIVMLSQLLTTGVNTNKTNPAMSDAAVAARLKPVGQIEVTDPNAPVVVKTGKQVVDSVCGTCHASGVLSAPKTGDKGAWGKLISRGLPNLTQSAIKGIRNMPARGGNPDLTDIELARAVAYMANQAGANFKEPEAAPAAAPAKKK